MHRGWTCDERCRFCSCKETIDHLFFSCSVAKYVWNVSSCALDCNVMPGKLEELYDWILSFEGNGVRQVVESGVASVLWGLWKIRNKACFQHVYPADPNSLVIIISQLLFSWSILQRKKLGKILCYGAKLLLVVASDSTGIEAGHR